MKLRLPAIVLILSLLLCVAVVALWVTSYGRNQSFWRLSSGAQYYAVSSADGRLSFWHMSPPYYVPAPSTPLPPGTVRVPVRTANRMLTVPHWAIAALLLLASAVATRMHLLQRRELSRRARGLCLHCGYDLRASTEKCPECGSPIPAQLHS